MSADNQKNKINSNKSFGYVFFFVFLIIALWPLYKGNEIRIWAISISLLFLVLGIINSRVLTPLNRLWYKFGLLLGTIVSPIVMAAVFFMVVTPTAYIMRLLRKDLLKILYSKKNSYWIKRDKNITTMRKQF
tara:strand:- start:163 stop:558 length:396 start_codon:yes stop_codon:yes gene_type:complete